MCICIFSQLKEKQKRLHEEQQQAYNRRHLEQTTKENMNILVRFNKVFFIIFEMEKVAAMYQN